MLRAGRLFFVRPRERPPGPRQAGNRDRPSWQSIIGGAKKYRPIINDLSLFLIGLGTSRLAVRLAVVRFDWTGLVIGGKLRLAPFER